jgi:hypothetical protein
VQPHQEPVPSGCDKLAMHILWYICKLYRFITVNLFYCALKRFSLLRERGEKVVESINKNISQSSVYLIIGAKSFCQRDNLPT